MSEIFLRRIGLGAGYSVVGCRGRRQHFNDYDIACTVCLRVDEAVCMNATALYVDAGMVLFPGFATGD